MLTIGHDEPSVLSLVEAIHSGNLVKLRQLLAENPALASASLVARKGRSRGSLHIVADWPGFFPNGGAVVKVLVAAGADTDVRTSGRFAETPLHYAASSDDLEVASALIEGGANIEAPGGSIGTPLDNAVGYGCWQVARLLVDRGARVDKLWHAAALGMSERLEELFNEATNTDQDEINAAFWQACHAGEPRTAAYLFRMGADVRYVPNYSTSTPLEIARTLDTKREILANWLSEHQ